MSSAEVFWGLLPAAVAAVGLGSSVRSFLRSPTLVQGLLGLPATVAYVGSLLVLAQMVRRHMRMLPTFVPHIAIGVAFALSLLQSSIAGPPPPKSECASNE